MPVLDDRDDDQGNIGTIRDGSEPPGEFDSVDIGHFIIDKNKIGDRTLGLSEDECEAIELAAPMHDIGKMGVPDEILRKKGKFTSQEYEIMKNHSYMGFQILSGSSSHFINLGAVIALNHQERFDGSGYPSGIQGEEIPLPARIVAVADVFDALTSVRPYKPAWPISQAVEYIREQSGVLFDPLCVDAFMSRLSKIHDYRIQLGDLDGDDGDETGA